MMSKNKQISPHVSPKNRLAPTYCRYIITTKRWTLMLLRLYLDYLAQKILLVSRVLGAPLEKINC